MEFIDCHVSYGWDIGAADLCPVRSVDEVCLEMARAGVQKAVVWRMEENKSGPVVGNALLAEDLKKVDNLYGVWALVPSHTHEIPDPCDMPGEMKKNGIIGWMLAPKQARYMPKPFVLRDWLELGVKRRIPLFIDTAYGVTLDETADLLKEYPELTVILSYNDSWPNDRIVRPFVAEFPNVYLDMSMLITDGGIEDFVKEYGASRLLYGSGFPTAYFGSNMLMIKHADISEEDKVAIAGGNMKRIIEGVDL